MVTENLKAHSSIIKAIRQFFDIRGYTEIHSPRLVGLPGQEPHLEPFWVGVNVPNSDIQNATFETQSGSGSNPRPEPPDPSPVIPAALITSPEYSMKKLLAIGMDKIYDLGPCFRNEEPFDGSHDPEFLLLEWYRKNADLSSLMDETEEMVREVGERVTGNGLRVSEKPFRRITCEEAWKNYAGVDLSSLMENTEAIANVARKKGQTVTEEDMWDDVYFKIFLTEIEPKLASEPTFLYRYPASQAALARRNSDDERFSDRVELYIGGLELANGFVELTDAHEQRERFEEEQEVRRKLGKKTWPIDEELLNALPNMGEAVGMAFGVDRLAMLLTGSSSINDVIPFSARQRFVR